MLYLCWALLNIGFFLFFIFICFRATGLVREKLGLFASLIFVFALLSFIGHSHTENDNKEPNSNEIKKWKFNNEDILQRNSTAVLSVDLEQTLIAKYVLGIKYGQEKYSKLNLPLSAYSTTSGFVSGIIWKPNSILVNTTVDNNKFEYFVDGIREWKLLGATIYSQPKSYKGFASIK